ncbi:MAG: hypothetical protein IJO62_03020 [Clostridia bacterium]|nr:hypothetical protein [Clostridia bacterium]
MKREIQIYRESFGVSEEFENLLFKASPETFKVNNQTVSQLFLLQATIVKNEINIPCKYLFAAATKREERKKGYMKKLISGITENQILILRPANKTLINYYKKLGFTLFTANDYKNNGFAVEPEGHFRLLADLEGKTNDGEFPLMAVNSPIDLNGIYFPFTLP